MSIHDPCPVRKKTQVHLALCNLLEKMNIEFVKTKFSGTRSVCTGDDFYSKVFLDKIHKHMKKPANSMPCEDVCVNCVSCIKFLHISEKTQCT